MLFAPNFSHKKLKNMMNAVVISIIFLVFAPLCDAMEKQKNIDTSTFTGIWHFIKSSETGAEILDYLKTEKYETQRKDLLCKLSCFAIGACTVLEDELNGVIKPMAKELDQIANVEREADRLLDFSLGSLPYTFLLFSLGYMPKYLLSLSRLPTSWPRTANVVNNASLVTMSLTGAIVGFTGIMIVKSLHDMSNARREKKRMVKESTLVSNQVDAVERIIGLRKLIEDKYPHTLELNSGNLSPNEHRKVSLGDTMSAEVACKVLEKLRPVYSAFELKDTNVGKSIATTLGVLRRCNIKNI